MNAVYSSVYSKTCVKRPLSKNHKLVFKNNYHLMQVKSIAECSKGSILQYFQPSLSHHLSLRSLFCLFLSSRFTQVLLYCTYATLSQQHESSMAHTYCDRCSMIATVYAAMLLHLSQYLCFKYATFVACTA